MAVFADASAPVPYVIMRALGVDVRRTLVATGSSGLRDLIN